MPNDPSELVIKHVKYDCENRSTGELYFFLKKVGQLLSNKVYLINLIDLSHVPVPCVLDFNLIPPRAAVSKVVKNFPRPVRLRHSRPRRPTFRSESFGP
jgi:hypothetical protein